MSSGYAVSGTPLLQSCDGSVPTDDDNQDVPGHIAAPDVCDGTAAVGESRHRIPRRIRWQPTEPCCGIALT
jgi:hypothetical protein